VGFGVVWGLLGVRLVFWVVFWVGFFLGGFAAAVVGLRCAGCCGGGDW